MHNENCFLDTLRSQQKRPAITKTRNGELGKGIEE